MKIEKIVLNEKDQQIQFEPKKTCCNAQYVNNKKLSKFLLLLFMILLLVLTVGLIKLSITLTAITKVTDIGKVYDLNETILNYTYKLNGRNLDLSKKDLCLIEPNTFNNLDFSINEINLASNRLHTIENGTFNNLNRLQVLDLGYNKLSSIQPFTFRNLISLYSLYLKHNQIDMVSSNAFSGLSKLELIDLSFNRLLFISLDLTGLKINSISLASNHLRDFKLYCKEKTINLQKLDLTNNSLEMISQLYEYSLIGKIYISYYTKLSKRCNNCIFDSY